MWNKTYKLFAVTCLAAGISYLLVFSRGFSPLARYHFCKLSSLWDSKFSQYAEYGKKCVGKYFDFHDQLNVEQRTTVGMCIATYLCERKEGVRREREQRRIRYTSPTYLENTGLMIEADGHIGRDVKQFNSRYHPKMYIVLEPVVKFYKLLKEKFNGTENIILLNYGIGVEDGEYIISNSTNDGTSIFKKRKQKLQTGNTIKIVSVSKFFDQMKIDEREVDLLTMNCEGCEYAVLDYLLSTGRINRVKNIQFQSHVLPGICQPIRRICWYQELLQKTHKLVYQFKFNWESWTLL